jgi:aspartate 1-decarboxylase
LNPIVFNEQAYTMIRNILRAKIHRATITDANLNYEGSITIPLQLIEAGDFLEYEQVHVWNITNGSRFQTYVIKGDETGSICVNGGGARHVAVGDLVIIAAFASLEEKEARVYKPKIVFVDDKNRVK